MSNNKDFKVKNGIQAAAYHEGVGTVNVAGGVATLDLSTGSVFELTPTENLQVSLTNPAASGTVSAATLLVNYGRKNVRLGSREVINTYSLVSGSSSPIDIHFKSDGTKFFVVDDDDFVYQYSLSTAWSISTASYDSKSYDLTQGTDMNSIDMSSDGTKLYALDATTDTVYQHTLSTAWDISTASYDSVSFSVATQESLPECIRFKSDGTTMYIGGRAGNGIDEYTLGTAWDLSTASASQFTSFGYDVHFMDITSDGTELVTLEGLVTDPGMDTMRSYTLATPWDTSTAVFNNDRAARLEASGNIRHGFTFGEDDKYLYVCGFNGPAIYQWTASEGGAVSFDSSISVKSDPLPLRPDETDVFVMSTRDGGTSYKAARVIEGAK